MDETLTALDTAAAALKSVDLRTLPRTGTAREDVKEARARVASAISAVRVNLAVSSV